MPSPYQIAASSKDNTVAPFKRGDPNLLESEAFRSWFGSSKVVDKGGDPLVVYHGTGAFGFERFDRAHGGRIFDDYASRGGIFFTPDFHVAEAHAASAVEHEEMLGNREAKAGVYFAYLSLQNPIEIDGIKFNVRSDRDTMMLGRQLARAERNGHDGAIIRGWYTPGDEVEYKVQYVVFDPKSIMFTTEHLGAQTRRRIETEADKWNDWLLWQEIERLFRYADEYGLMRCSMRELASAAYRRTHELRPLKRKGLLRGADVGEIVEPFVLVPLDSGPDDESVTLIERQEGPLWYSRRLVVGKYMPGAVYAGTKHGKAAYETPDGRQFIER